MTDTLTPATKATAYELIGRLPAPIVMLGTGLLSLLAYATVMLTYPLFTFYTTERTILYGYTNSAPVLGFGFLLIVLVVFGCYGAGALALKNAPAISTSTIAIIGAITAANIAVAFMTQTITSTDLYDYLFRGSMVLRYGANPFVQPPVAFLNDPLFRFVVWPNAVTAYGPAWEALSTLAARCAGEQPDAPAALYPRLLLLLIAYKALAVIGFLLCAGALWFVMPFASSRQRWLNVYLWLANPLVLWEAASAGHNDYWMLFPTLVAIGCLQRFANRADSDTPHSPRFVAMYTTFALVALMLGVLVKYLVVIFAPLVMVTAMRRLPTWRWRIGVLTGNMLLCGAVLVGAYVPFWQGPATLTNFLARGSMYTSTWLAVVHEVLTMSDMTAFGNILLSIVSVALLAFGVGWSCWKAWIAPHASEATMLWLLLWFLAVCNPWFFPWYMLWFMALSIAVQDRLYRLLAIGLTILGLTNYGFDTFVFLPLGLYNDGAHALLQAALTMQLWLPVQCFFVLYRRLHATAANSRKTDGLNRS